MPAIVWHWRTLDSFLNLGPAKNCKKIHFEKHFYNSGGDWVLLASTNANCHLDFLTFIAWYLLAMFICLIYSWLTISPCREVDVGRSETPNAEPHWGNPIVTESHDKKITDGGGDVGWFVFKIFSLIFALAFVSSYFVSKYKPDLEELPDLKFKVVMNCGQFYCIHFIFSFKFAILTIEMNSLHLPATKYDWDSGRAKIRGNLWKSNYPA